MFMDESAFDEIDEIKVTSKFASRPSTAVTTNNNSNSNTLNLDELDQDNDDDLPAFRSAGTLSAPSSSRARVFAQQRELQLKKRQSQMQNTGMVRSSIDSVNSPAKSDGQFTPAVRQFSAPKAVKDITTEGSEFTPRQSFTRPMSASAQNRSFQQPRRTISRYSDDDDDDDSNVGNVGSNNRKENSPKPKNGNRANTRAFEEEQYEPRRGKETRQKPPKDDDDNDNDFRRSANGRNHPQDDQNNRWANRTVGDRRGDDPRNGNTYPPSSITTAASSSNVNSPDPTSTAVSARPVTVPPDLSNMRRFLTSPVPKNCGTIQCYIRRNKSGTNKLFPIYSLFLKEGDVFLMASRKRPKNKTSNYLISMDQHDLNRSGSAYLGKLRSNFVGTEFQIFDDGLNPKGAEGDDIAGANSSVRCEMGAVMYAANVLGSRGPRKMQVAIPGLDENGQITKWKDGSGPNGPTDDMLTRMKDRNFRDLVYLINKPPRWNEQVGAYVLNFNGRVTMASVKNFQLVDPEEQNAVVLQFGRVGKDEFTMDLQYPMSPFQAFALTLSSFDSKIACD